MRPLRERLKDPGAILADGAMGTMLFQRGLKAGDCPERWNLERPGILEEISAAYLAAGAEILETNTFGGSPLKLAAYQLQDRAEEVNARGVACARKAAAGRAYVAGSVGPSGRLLLPYGDVSPDEVAESFRRQMRALVGEGVDLICIETMTDLAEALLAVEAARSVSSEVPVCATLTFDPTPRGFFTLMGTGIGQAAGELARSGADVVGSNCGNGIRNMAAIAEEFLKATALPVLIQSNAGLPEMRDGAPVFPETPELMAREGRRMLERGVKILGGCCGTTPRHIAALRPVMDAPGPPGVPGPSSRR